MRIVSWNCNCKFRAKYRSLLAAYDPDILVIPECEDPAASADAGYQGFAAEYQYRWTGRWPFKGLGVFVRPGIEVTKLDWPDGGHQVFLPVRVAGFTLLAAWPGKPYIPELCAYLALNSDKIDEDTIIAGDLNTSPVLDTRRTEKTHMNMVRFLAGKELLSAYHWQTKEEHGRETEPTFYLYRDPAKSYHFDYCFLAPKRLQQCEIGSAETWMGKGNAGGSDHLPLIVDIEE